MDEQAIRVAFDTRLEAALSDAGNYPTLENIAVAWENTPNITADKWLRVKVVTDTSENGTVGVRNQASPFIKHEGNYVISIFVKLNTGMDISGLLVSELTILFQNETFSGVIVSNPTPRTIGNDVFGFHGVNLFVPFKTSI